MTTTRITAKAVMQSLQNVTKNINLTDMDQLFNVLYPHDGSINHSCELKGVAYEFKYAVSCATLDETFRHGQAFHNPGLEFVGCRSMCIGDIVLDEKGNFFMVMPVGYRLIDDEIITFHQREEEVYS